MQLLLALALIAQVVAPGRAWTMNGPSGLLLATADSTYTLTLGEGCDSVVAGMTVEYLALAGTENAGAINPLDTDDLCFVTVAPEE